MDRFMSMINLHSTMFLLIPVEDFDRMLNNLNLHSTMFLLIPVT